MTELELAIRSAVARTRVEADLPASVVGAIEAAGYVIVERGRWNRVLVAAETGYWWQGKEPGDVDSAY